jgi:hypothetical protein
VPPNLRVVEESACEKDWNRRFHVVLRNADAGIADGELQFVPGFALFHRQHDLALLGEFDRVAEQVDQDLAQAGHIAFDAGRHVVVHDVGDVESFFDGAPGRQVQRGFDAFAQVEGLEFHVHPARLDLAEVEDVVDDGEQGVARVADGFGVVALFIVELGIHEQAAHTDDRVHRVCGSRDS